MFSRRIEFRQNRGRIAAASGGIRVQVDSDTVNEGDSVIASFPNSEGLTVTQVKFYIDDLVTPANTDNAAPWQYTSVALTPGTHLVQAEVTSAERGPQRSNIVQVRAIAQAPTLTAPADETTFAPGDSVTISATTFDDTATTKVEWYRRIGGVDTLIGTDSATAYSQTWDTTGLADGDYQVYALRYTADGTVASSLVDVHAVTATNPTTIFGTDLHTWLAPEDWVLSGSNITQWNDSSGHANHFVQATGANQPVVSAAWKNGLDAADFVSSDRLSCAAYHAQLQQPCTKIVIMDLDSVAAARVIVTGADTTNRIQIGVVSTPTWRIRSNTTSDGGTPAVATKYYLIYQSAIDASSTDSLTVNGSATISADCGDASENGGFIGTESSASFPHDGRIGEYIIVKRVLTGSDLTSLNTYITNTWGAFP